MKISKTTWLTYYEATYNNCENHAVSVGGFFNSASYADAATQIEDYFSNDLLSIDKIEMYDDDMLTLSLEIARDAKRNYNEGNT